MYVSAESRSCYRETRLKSDLFNKAMEAKYGDEVSNLKISKIIGEFFAKHVRNFSKRIFYNYYLRDMSLASIELPVGLILLGFGSIYGSYHWINSIQTGITAPAGTVMLSAMPVLIGLQLILAFLSYDISSLPRSPLHRHGVVTRREYR